MPEQITLQPIDSRIGAGAGFFQLSLSELHRVVRESGGHREMAAYVVLCSGVNMRSGTRYCTHGAQSVHRRTGMSYRSAGHAIDWLVSKGFIRLPTDQDVLHLGKGQSKFTKVQYVIDEIGEPDVAVSRQFVEGHTKSKALPPFGRLFEEVAGFDSVSRAEAVMDACVLFFTLMKEQDFGGCGGVDPDQWSREFVAIDDDEDGDGSKHIKAIDGTDCVMVSVREAHAAAHRFIKTTPAAAAGDDNQRERFWHAVRELRSLKLLYQVVVMWDGNPHDPAQHRKCEPIATLYINDRWAREIDDHLQYEVNQACWRAEARDRVSDFKEADESSPFSGTGRYRYIVQGRAARSVRVVGQLRVRYWAPTASTVEGRGRDAQRTKRWHDTIRQIGRPIQFP